MSYEFPDSLYPDVRAAIGLDVTEVMIPDEVLALSIYEGEAERWVERNLTEEQYTDASQVESVNTAATLYLASLVAPRLRIVISERIAGGNMTYANVDLEAVSKRLLDQAGQRVQDIIVELDPAEENTAIPIFFTKASRHFRT